MFIRNILNPDIFNYLVVGGLTAILYFMGIFLTTEIFLVNYRIGVSTSYFLAVIFHFFANRKYTFLVIGGNLKIQLLRHSTILLVNYLITFFVISFSVDIFGLSAYVGAFMSIVVTFAVGYLASKFWIFQKKRALECLTKL